MSCQKPAAKQHTGSIHLPPRNDRPPIGAPSKREPFPANLDLRRAGLGAHIPQPDRAVRATASELRLLGRVPCDALNRAGVSAQLGRVLDRGLVRVPDAQRAVARPGRYQMARRAPG